MTYLLMAFVCGFIGVVPLFLNRKLTVAILVGTISSGLLWFFFWVSSASIVGPTFGPMLPVVLALMAIAAIIDVLMEDKITFVIILPIALFLILIIAMPFLGSEMLRSKDYASLIGPIQEKIWSQDIQPKDPRHIRLANRENAVYLARNSVSLAGGVIGSQFEISEESMTLQKINGAFWYVVPLDFKDDYGIWSSTKRTPGYIMINADDVDTEPTFKKLADDKKFQYTPNAFFEYNLERHLRMNGYLDVGLTNYKFEIDDAGKPWWVVSTYQPTITMFGKKITGVVVVDPVDGAITPYSLENIPDWVDRTMPREYVKEYLKYFGMYKSGYINTMNFFGGKEGMMEPEEPIMIFGSDGSLDWVIGMTSKTDTDTALVGLVYVNSRNGHATFYKTNGGSTDSAILDAVQNNQYVKFKSLHPADPQIYNLYGTMASIMPLLNDSHARQGVAIVDVTDVQKVAVGNDLYEALNSYQEMIGNKVKAGLEKTREIVKFEGELDRVHAETQANGTIYRLHIKNIPHIFIAGKNISRKITISEPGDKVLIECYDSGEEEIPMTKFDNLAFQLEGTKVQVENTLRAEKALDEQQTEKNAATTQERVKNLTPQQLKELEKHIPQQ